MHGDWRWLSLAAYTSCVVCMLNATNQNLHTVRTLFAAIPSGLKTNLVLWMTIRPLPEAACLATSMAPSSLDLETHHRIATSVLLAIIRRLSSISHVIHLAILHLPSTILQHPDVIASIEDAESLVDVVKSTLDPVRPGDTGKTMISKCNQDQIQD